MSSYLTQKISTYMRQRKVHEILTFLKRSKGLEIAERYGSSLKDDRNTVAEHSWRLALMAFVITTECNVRVDMAHVLTLALIHDLAEAKTGDIDAYNQIKEGSSLVESKALQEATAMEEITGDLSFGSRIYDLWQEYEAQETVESKFVRALDKIEGFLHIAEVGVSAYIPKEFHADYADKAVAAFDETTHHFPEMKDLLDAIKLDLREQFEKAGVAWIEHTPA